ncbi:DotU family type IV/VI secretion system protein [Roseibium polysiphoniae]|uniref:DotU family type IV/VI secretion system protein n=1 Tax=Roseibium polysiphoniae TaxID=2571221 RepID=A0A944CHC8_9HYPH|nr:type IVB secretion system protein IcmH/DotU [Roseibium polysiphoniae]MBS8262602.1 DotU family type IV/VI secretion system protein [Roseibium polysiphoniae]
MSDDLDQPTVARRLSPRARTSLADMNTPASGARPDLGDEPTVAILGEDQFGQKKPSANNGAPGGTVPTASTIVRLLEPEPERRIVRAASPLLLLISQLRNSVEQADVRGLRQQVVEEIDRFEQATQKDGVEAGDIIAARYILCATVDETVLMTPWGSRSEWSSNSLLNQFHNETWGGEKVFSILDRISAEPAKKLSLLLLIHSCLMLGFEGRFRVLEGGKDQLEDLRSELSRTIRRYSNVKPDQPLSKVVKGFQRGRRLSTLPPLWILGTIGLFLLVVVRGYAEFTLDGELIPVLSDIKSLSEK